ncbi:MAG: hypothetical protein HY000_17205 [Planctomycetes bacterium]|nr:hypothetical protein [Planctomycetota bacterium]
MASLLAELLHDVSRRAGEIEAEFERLRAVVPPEVESYRANMQQRALRAKQLAERILADPDLGEPMLAVNFFRDFRDIARFIQALEHLPLLVLRRFSEQDRLMTRLCRQICAEIAYPYAPPLCSSLSSQYYWTVADMDLVFVPSLEPERLLGLADIYHEIGHIVLYRGEKRFVIPGLSAVEKAFDAALHQGKLAGWPQQSLNEVEQYHARWRSAWFLEFGADLIATYLAGPAFGWCNIRTSTNLGGEIFQGSQSHPTDDARAAAINLMLQRLGHHQQAQAIAERWNELVALSGERKPPRYDIAYPGDLLDGVCQLVFDGCQQLGLLPWTNPVNSSAIVGSAVDDAWTEFRLRPDSFAGYEQNALSALWTRLS